MAGLLGAFGGGGGDPFWIAPPDAMAFTPLAEESPLAAQKFLARCQASPYRLDSVLFQGTDFLEQITATYLDSETGDASGPLHVGGDGGRFQNHFTGVGSSTPGPIAITYGSFVNTVICFAWDHETEPYLFFNDSAGPNGGWIFPDPASQILGFFGRAHTYIDRLGVIVR